MLPWTATLSPAKISGFSTTGRNPHWGSSCKQSTASSLKPLLTLTVVPHKLLFTLPPLTTSRRPCSSSSHLTHAQSLPLLFSSDTQRVSWQSLASYMLPWEHKLLPSHSQLQETLFSSMHKRTTGVPWFGNGATAYLKQSERLYGAVNIFWLSWHFTLLVV